jgi:imidazolonepropionase-like amidohydrolase
MTFEIARRGLIMGLGALPCAALAGTREPATLLLRNAQVFDGTEGRLFARNVRVTGDRITAVAAGDISVPADATIVDCAGQTLMPGLSDAHWHMSAVKGVDFDGPDDGLAMALIVKDAESQLMRGFTTVRDASGPVFGIKAAIDRGVIPGPRCFPSGAAISQTSGHGDGEPVHELPVTLGGTVPRLQRLGLTAVANGIPEVLAATRAQLKKGASQIKIMAGGGVTSDYDPIDTLQYTMEELRAIVGAASDWGTYVSAHVYTPAGIARCVDAGVVSIEHGHALDDRTAAMMAEKGVWLSTQPFEPGDNRLTDDQLDRANKSIGPGGWQTSARLAKRHGVKIAFGTDLFSRTRTSRTENTMLVRLGGIFSNVETLRMATAGNCSLFERSGARNPYGKARLGVIREGAWADMLLVRGNPLDRLELLEDFERNFLLIVKDGTIFKNLMPA